MKEGKNLVIVESPAKAGTIQKFLGEGFTVKSSFGHIRDLKKKDFGVNLDTFTPEYELSNDKQQVVSDLRKAAKQAKTVGFRRTNGKKYRVGMFGGAGANTLAAGKFDYPEAREGYRAALHRLMEEKVDVMPGNHVWNNDTEEKGLHLLKTGENLFIDSELWGKFLRHCEKRLDKVIEQEAKT